MFSPFATCRRNYALFRVVTRQRLELSTLIIENRSCLSTVIRHVRHDDVESDASYVSPDPTKILYAPYNLQQIRWKGRNDGNRFLTKSRTPTKKARKNYHRNLQKIQSEQDKHGKPGSKAGPRREYQASMEENIREEMEDFNQRNELLASGISDVALLDDADSSGDYDFSDALLDDLMGNTSEHGCTPTPEPVYLGHKYTHYYNKVVDQMMEYRKAISNEHEINEESSVPSTSTNQLLDISSATLPSDFDISLALRSFRDNKGSRARPVGIVAILKYLVQDLGVPLLALGEFSYTTILTCCRNEHEARRVFSMMKKQNIPISEYSWSILVDIHAKIGDYNGCVAVQEEMARDGGIAPTLASYTSLFAGCYRVCIDGRVSSKVRFEAAKVGWEKWREMRIVGIEPDVMAYGAILRLAAATGQPEKALNFLEEMQQMQVKPTTLCFTSALRAVARSQSVAIRYQKGSSKKNRRREYLTRHHGKLALSVLIMAENAEVEQDDGFVAALIMCAGEAGDMATAKAIYMASQIRRLEQFRSIGPDSHLAQLQGAGTSLSSEDVNSTTNQLVLRDKTFDGIEGTKNIQRTKYKKYLSYGEREYGKDNRVLSAVLHACARAVDKSGIGTMWQGRENNGYLCENSLRLINARQLPRYAPHEIPGQKLVDNLTYKGEHIDKDDYRPGKRIARKFEGIDVHEEAVSNINDLDELYQGLYLDKTGRLKTEFQPTRPEDIWKMKYEKKKTSGEDKRGKFSRLGSNGVSEDDSSRLSNEKMRSLSTGIDNPKPIEEMYFDYDSMSWKTRMTTVDNGMSDNTNVLDYGVLGTNDRLRQHNKENATQEEFQQINETSFQKSVPSDSESSVMYFDYEEMRWKSRTNEQDVQRQLTPFEKELLVQNEVKETLEAAITNSADDSGFDMFFDELKAELEENGEEEVSEEEARELFFMVKDEYNEMMDADLGDLDMNGNIADLTLNVDDMNEMAEEEEGEGQKNGDLHNQLQLARSSEPVASNFFDYDSVSSELEEKLKLNGLEWDDDTDDLVPFRNTAQTLDNAANNVFYNKSNNTDALTVNPSDFRGDNNLSLAEANVLDYFDDDDYELEELRSYLPGLSDKRLRKILNAFKKSLGNPNLRDLVEIVRERMPDYITATWLKKMSILTANYILQRASQEGLVDTHVLNGVLELHTSAGSIEDAIQLHAEQFHNWNLVPTGYSDRLVMQMLLKNQRLQRALSFKQHVEEHARILDIKSYGSLIAYLSNRQQLGSAMLVLKECIAIHNAPPDEASLLKFRLLCRKNNVDLADIGNVIGPDPMEWIRYGEANLKREMSKRGKRDVLMVKSQLVRM